MDNTNTKKVVIRFTANRDAIILLSPTFSTLNIQHVKGDLYQVEIDSDYGEMTKELIERNGGKIQC